MGSDVILKDIPDSIGCYPQYIRVHRTIPKQFRKGHARTGMRY